MANSVKTYSFPMDALAGSPECRFDAGHYSPDLFGVLTVLDQSGLKLERLGDVVDAVILPNRFSRIYVDPEEGVPFLQGSHVVHFQPADVKYLSPATLRNMDAIIVRAGWVLVTRSGSVGRVTLCPSEWDGWAASEHIIRVIPNEKKCLAGYLCSYLASSFGQVQLSANIHGAVVDEITDEQVKNILVPIPKKKKDVDLVRAIDQGMKRAIELKSQAVVAAQSSVTNTSAWLQPSDAPHQKDLRIPDTTPEQLAKTLLSGGARPRSKTKRRKAS